MQFDRLTGRRGATAGLTLFATACSLAGCAASVNSAGREADPTAAVASAPQSAPARLFARLTGKAVAPSLAGTPDPVRGAPPGADPFLQEPAFVQLNRPSVAEVVAADAAGRAKPAVEVAGAALQPALVSPVAGVAAAPRTASSVMREPNPFDVSTVTPFVVRPPEPRADAAIVQAAGAENNPFAAEAWAAPSAVTQVAASGEPLPPGRPLGAANPFAAPAPSSFGRGEGPSQAGPPTVTTQQVVRKPAVDPPVLGDSQPLQVRAFLGGAPTDSAAHGGSQTAGVPHEDMIVDVESLPKRGRFAETPSTAEANAGVYPITPRKAFAPPAWLAADDAPAVATANTPTELAPFAAEPDAPLRMAAATDLRPLTGPTFGAPAANAPAANAPAANVPARELTVPELAVPQPTAEPTAPQELAAVGPSFGPTFGPADGDPFAAPESPAVKATDVGPESNGPALLAPPDVEAKPAPRRTRLHDYSDDAQVRPIAVVAPAAAEPAGAELKPSHVKRIVGFAVLFVMGLAIVVRRRFR